MGIQCHVSCAHRVHSSTRGWTALCNSQEIVFVYTLFFWTIIEGTILLRALSTALHVRTVIPVGLFSVQDLLYVWTKLQGQTSHICQFLRHVDLRHSYLIQLYRTGANCCTVILCFPVHGIFGEGTSSSLPKKLFNETNRQVDERNLSNSIFQDRLFSLYN